MTRRTAIYLAALLIGFLAVMHTRPKTQSDLAQYGITHALEQIQ